MFNNTDLLERLPVKIAKNIPKDAIGISYFESPNIDPHKIINIINHADKIKDNNDLKKKKEFFSFEDSNHEVPIGNGQDKFLIGETRNVSVTNVFYKEGNIELPLYYKNKLIYPIKTKQIPSKKNFIFVDEMNFKIEIKELRIEFDNILNDDDEPTDLYNVIIYSEENLSKKGVKIKYNAFINGKVQNNYKESLNSEETLLQNIDYELVKSEEEGMLEGQSFKDTVAKVKLMDHVKFKEKRNLINIIYSIKSKSGKFNSEPVQDKIINPDFAINEEELNRPDDNNYNQNLYYLINGNSIMEHFKNEDPSLTDASFEGEEFEIEIIGDEKDIDTRIKEQVIFDFESDGSTPIGAKVFCNTGYGYQNKIKVKDLSDYKNEEGIFLSKFAVKINDTNPIQLDKPMLNFSDSNWFINVDFGYFYDKKEDGTLYKYVLDEIDEKTEIEYGKPYSKITGEKPLIVNDKLLKVKNNSVISLDGYPKVYKFNQYGIKEFLEVERIDKNEGLLELQSLNKNDDLFVDYIYKKTKIKYNGFYDGIQDKYHYLDLKPTKDNYSFFPQYNNEIKNNLNLINQPIYFYIRPKYLIKNNSKEVINEKTYIYHRFEEVNNENELLIGVLYVSPNITSGDIDLIDIRQRGGGIKKEYEEIIRTEEKVDMDSFWDVGYWNGKPYNENNVIVININESILKANGGNLSKEDVERKVEKWIPYGNMPLINYVKGYKNETLEFEKTQEKEIFNKIDHEIDFFLEKYRTVPTSKFTSGVYSQIFIPQLNMEIVDEPFTHELKPNEVYENKRNIYLDGFFENYNTTDKTKFELDKYNKVRELKDLMQYSKIYNTMKTSNQPIEKVEKYNTTEVRSAGIEIYEK